MTMSAPEEVDVGSEEWKPDGTHVWIRGVHAGHFSTVHGEDVAERRARLASAAPALLSALLDVEWSGTFVDRYGDEFSCCPHCLLRRFPNERHAPDCLLAAAIRKARGA
jgi:hypothetical protein